ncbi:Tetraspanin-11 [Trichinella papuae]|uniref:Tetraspanin-11 n=1 Tax=Trichinella papuae TaxID=268474 RepID=A0A0V1NA06_9BILA|nr:Tetraspanin-11 [Trichinella papuae]
MITFFGKMLIDDQFSVSKIIQNWQGNKPSQRLDKKESGKRLIVWRVVRNVLPPTFKRTQRPPVFMEKYITLNYSTSSQIFCNSSKMFDMYYKFQQMPKLNLIRWFEVRCTSAFIRSFLYCFNIVTWILGLVSLGIGIWLYTERTDYSDLTSHAFGAYSASALFGAAGATIIIVGFVGCCGVWVENRSFIILYMILVVLLFIIELTAAVLAFIYKSEMTEIIRLELHNHLLTPFVSEHARDSKGLRISWDTLQSKFKCCGAESYKDWAGKVPESCCDPSFFHENGSMINCGRINKPNILFQKGCYEAFSDWLLEHMQLVGAMGIFLACIQVFGLLASALLYVDIFKRERNRGKNYQLCSRTETDSRNKRNISYN